jgi:hypothetical protein
MRITRAQRKQKLRSGNGSSANEMQQAIAAYRGPVTMCPPGKSTSDPYGLSRRHRKRLHARQEPIRNAKGR